MANMQKEYESQKSADEYLSQYCKTLHRGKKYPYVRRWRDENYSSIQQETNDDDWGGYHARWHIIPSDNGKLLVESLFNTRDYTCKLKSIFPFPERFINGDKVDLGRGVLVPAVKIGKVYRRIETDQCLDYTYLGGGLNICTERGNKYAKKQIAFSRNGRQLHYFTQLNCNPDFTCSGNIDKEVHTILNRISGNN